MSLGASLLKCAEVQKQLGTAERKFVQSTNIHFLTPLRKFTEVEYKAIQVTSSSVSHHTDGLMVVWVFF